MPPEQLPWDRRDFRKHERSGSDQRFGGGGPNRWREQNHNHFAPPPHPQPYHHNQQRCYSDFRSSRPIPPGHGKQGNWQTYPDDTGHGFLPFTSRYGDRNQEDDNFRPFGNHGDGRYFRNSRENRGLFSQRDWRSSSWQPAASSSGPGRPTPEVNNQKPVENTETCNDNSTKSNDTTHPPPDSFPGQSQSLVKESNKKGEDVANELVIPGQKIENENALESVVWKPLKWSRSGSLSSRGSALSHSDSSKSTGVESEVVVNAQQKNVTPVQCPDDVFVGSSAPATSDETISRKKPRLGWGEGLAKYEKKKVDGPEEVATKDGLVVSVSDAETIQFPSVNMLDKSPRVASFSDCTESTTPMSVACSSSPGIEEKESVKAVNIDHDTANWSCSPSALSQTQYEGPPFNLENLDLASIANLSSLINELVQSDDPSSVETGYARTTSMNKLLVWKVEILKSLELTESEIDSLETLLKSLVAKGSAASSLLPGECRLKPCEELVTGSSFTFGPAPLQVVLSEAMNFENLPEHEHVASKDDEIDSPGSATSKLTEILPSGEDTFPSEPQHCVEGPKRTKRDSFCSLAKCLDDGLGNQDVACSTVDDKLIETNKYVANVAMEELKLLPKQQIFLDTPTLLSTSSFQSDPSLIKEKFLKKKWSHQFKEKIITLKFKVFQRFWKEGRVVSIRKLRGKSHKKFDPSHTGCKKNRSSSRARISYSGGSVQTVPAEEVIKYINRLLSDSPFKPCRTTLKTPALILDKNTQMSRFITKNALVEDPCALEKERSIINPWSAEERELFIDKLASFGKDFSKISSFLERKTIAECIEFYYKNHKSEQFERARKKPDFEKHKKSQSSTYLVASGKRWNREVNKVPRGEDAPLKRSNSLDVYNDETVAADVLAGICGSLSSEAVSSCITSSVDRIDGYQDRITQRVGSCMKRPMTPDVTQNVDDECSDESCGEMDPTDWTDEEKSAFIRAVLSYGKDFTMISQYIRTRSKDQCKIFFSKARKCLRLDKIQPGVSTAVGNGGASNAEDVCVEQTCPITGNDCSECRMEEDLTPAAKKLSNDIDIAGTPSLDSLAAEPVVKSSSMGIALIDDSQAMDFNVTGEGGSCGSESEVATMAVSSESDSVRVKNGDHGDQPTRSSEADSNGMASDGHHEEDNEGRKPIISVNLKNKKIQDNGASSTIGASISSTVNEAEHGPQAAGNVSHPSVDAHSRILVGSGLHVETDPQNCSEKSCFTSVEQNGHFASVESYTLFSVPIKYQGHSSTNALSNSVTNGISENDSQKIVRTVDRQQHLSSYSRSDPDEFSKILRGYPVSVQNIKEINGDFNCKKHVSLHYVSKRDVKLHSDRHRDFSLQKCTGQKHQGELQVPFPSQDKSRDHSRPQSGSSSDVEIPSRNGDVKLFGKILTSSQQKPDSCAVGKGSDDQSKPGCQTLNLRFSGDQKVNLDSSQSKFDHNNYIGSESSHGSYNFWDGNRTNTGFTTLPNSALLLAKYPDAFTNHSTPSVKLDRPPLHGVIRSNDSSLNGSSVLPSRDPSSSNRVADYQASRNRQLPPFSLDMKQPQDVLFSEMQKRNSFDVASEMQQRSRGMVVTNVVGRVAGLHGQWSGVSDPVAAMKLHYAKAHNLSMQAGNGVREDDSWRSNRDVGKS